MLAAESMGLVRGQAAKPVVSGFETKLVPREASETIPFLMIPAIIEVHVVRHIVDGEWCATVFDFHTTFGVIPIVDCFRVVDGQILSIRPYYDPRPVIEGMNRAGSSA